MRYKELPSKELLAACSDLLSRKGKLERQLRDLRAALLLSGSWQHVQQLDRAWIAFAGNQGDWPGSTKREELPGPPEESEINSEPTMEDQVPPLRMHSFPFMARPSRLKKESA